MWNHKQLRFVPLLLIVVLLPFFEGGETSLGLFVIHSIVLLSFAIVAFSYSHVVIPRVLLFYLPFVAVLIISALFTSYKFAAFLRLWDFMIAGIWGILVCTLVRRNQQEFDSFTSRVFIFAAASTIAAILIYNTAQIMRISASFVNPNDYASFALLLVCFGVFCSDLEIHPLRKTVLLTLLGVLLLSISLSFSRGIFVAILSLLFAIFFQRRPSRIISILLIALVLISGSLVALRFRLYEDPLRYYRLKIWKSALVGLVETPYLGVGLGMLEYRSNKFNFPGDVEVGRFGKIARSADNQYVQILAETGFLGFFAFLFWWIGLAFSLRTLSQKFFYLRQTWLILTVTGLFSLPLQNTSILFLFFLMILFAVALDSKQEMVTLELHRPGRILVPVVSFLLLTFCVYLPYEADRQFHLAARARNPEDADVHLAKAVRYNPYQPYYRFAFIRSIVDAKPQISKERWMSIANLLDDAIALNPDEYEFYLYKARVLRTLLDQDRTLDLYSGSIASYQNALDCNPYNVFLRLEFASFLARFERYDLAVSQLKETLELEPAFLNARLLLAEILFKNNQAREAREEYSRFLKDEARLGKDLAYAPSPYIRSLLTVNQQQKKRIAEMSAAS